MVPSKPGRSQQDTEAHRGKVEGWKNGSRSIQKRRREQEEKVTGVRRSARESGEVLTPNHPGFRMSWPRSTQRSHPQS